jgi:hypothetical protein
LSRWRQGGGGDSNRSSLQWYSYSRLPFLGVELQLLTMT